jgi:hypothetical protein
MKKPAIFLIFLTGFMLSGCSQVEDFLSALDFKGDIVMGAAIILGAAIIFSALGDIGGRMGGEYTTRITIDDKSHYIGTGEYYSGSASEGTKMGNLGFIAPFAILFFGFGVYLIWEATDNVLFLILGIVLMIIVTYYLFRFILTVFCVIIQFLRYILYLGCLALIAYWLYTLKTK